MSTAKLCANPCDTCEKQGLPLLLARYAILPKEAGAPALSGNLNDKILGTIALGSHAAYGLRLLRSGYVYVYDERSYWDEYFVTADGFLSKLPPRPKAVKSRPAPRAEFACARSGAAPLAGVITIRNAKHAKAIWIGFSDVEWTDATLDKHNDATYRAKHMTRISITGGKVSPQPHTAVLDQVDKVVPEFVFTAGTVKKTVDPWAPFPFNSRLAIKDTFKEAVKKADPNKGAAIVALTDPVGLVQEIAAYMEVIKVTFMKNEAVAKPRFAASTIASLETAIKQQAKLSEIAAGEELARQAEAGPSAMYPSNPALWGMQGDFEQAKQWRTRTPESLQKVADAKWHAYTHDPKGKLRFNEAASQAWLKTYNDGFKDFDAKSIAPLAKAHAAWMQHKCLSEHLCCSYDDSHPENGVAYTATLVDLLRYTTDKQSSYDLYLSWLKNGEFTPENLVMRALALNQKDLIEKIEKADASPVDSRAFPSDGVAAAIAAYMEKMPASANAQLTALLAGLSGPALKYWDDFNAGKVGTKAAAALAAVTGKQIVRIPVVGNRGQFIQAYVEQLYRLDPELRTHPNHLQKAVAAQVRLMEIEGVPMQAKSKLGWYVLLDRKVVADATLKNLSGQALADELRKVVQKPADLRKLDLERAINMREGAMKIGTALSGVLLIWNYTKLMDDAENAMSHEKTESIAKLWAGKAAIGGFVSEQVGNQLEKLGEARLRNMMGRVGAYVPRALQVFGRFAGFGVGVFLGIWDLSNSAKKYQEKDFGLSGAYFLSGVAGIGVSAAMFAVAMGWIALGPIGWLLVGIGVLIWLAAAFFIETHKDNKLQEWLSRCFFGTGSEKYLDSKTEVEQYKLALAG